MSDLGCMCAVLACAVCFFCGVAFGEFWIAKSLNDAPDKIDLVVSYKDSIPVDTIVYFKGMPL
jgi:hypothetical protein